MHKTLMIDGPSPWSLKKRLLMMLKLSVVFLFLSFSTVFAEGSFAQTVTLRANNISLAKAMKDIKKQTGISYFLKGKDLADIRKDVDIEALLLPRAMDKLIDGVPASWVTENGTIVIRSAPNQRFKNIVTLEEGEKPDRLITGKVTDENGEALAGVTVVVKGTTNGTTTDVDGNYRLTVDDDKDKALVFSMVGFKKVDKRVEGNNVSVMMTSGMTGLDELIVVGYGTQKKGDLTSSISSINVDDATKAPISSISQALSGRAAGLNVDLNSAQPGGSVTFQIRGSATNRQPLIVIDGMPVADFSTPTVGYFGSGSIDAVLSTINPDDIKSIDILKDASATAIYGSKAAGGVILITTKKGEIGSNNVSFSSSTGFQKFFNVPHMLNPVQYMEENNRAAFEDWLYSSRQGAYSVVPKPTNWIEPEPYIPIWTDDEIKDASTKGTDWTRQVTRTGSIQDYNLSISGNHHGTQFYASLGYYNQLGVIKNNGMKKYSGRINLNQKLGERIEAGLTLGWSEFRMNNVLIGNGEGIEHSGIYNAALRYDPTLPVRDSLGNYSINTRHSIISNPVSFLEISNKNITDRLLTTIYLQYNILPDLNIRGQAGFDKNESQSYGYLPVSTMRGAATNGRADRSESLSMQYQIQLVANYLHTFGKNHKIDATLGTEYTKHPSEGMSVTATDFPFDGALWNSLSLGSQRPVISSFGRSSELTSYFARLNYDYASKYLLTINLRVDGSSNFSPDNQYALFPGVSFGWNISEENFMKNTFNWLDQLKFRIGVGRTGNDNTGTAFTDWYSPGFRAMWGNTILSGIGISGMGNPGLAWERQTDVNLGIDFSILGNRISGSFDMYNRVIDRILGEKLIGSWNPVTTVSTNMASKKQTYGYEFSINSRNVQKKNISWNTQVNFTYYRDRWLRRDPSYILKINETEKQYFDEIWLYKSSGLNPLNESHNLGSINTIPGTVNIQDLNGFLEDNNGNRIVNENGQPQYANKPDGKIDDADLVKIGVNVPITVGLSNTFRYKKFDLSIYVYGKFNQFKFNDIQTNYAGERVHDIIEFGTNMERSVVDRWNSDNTEGKQPSSLQYISRVANIGSGDFLLEKAWFVRVRNITMGYTLYISNHTTKPKKLRISLDIMNAFLFTPYNGMDPETDVYIGAYPPQRTYTLGVNLDL